MPPQVLASFDIKDVCSGMLAKKSVETRFLIPSQRHFLVRSLARFSIGLALHPDSYHSSWPFFFVSLREGRRRSARVGFGYVLKRRRKKEQKTIRSVRALCATCRPKDRKQKEKGKVCAAWSVCQICLWVDGDHVGF